MPPPVDVLCSACFERAAQVHRELEKLDVQAQINAALEDVLNTLTENGSLMKFGADIIRSRIGTNPFAEVQAKLDAANAKIAEQQKMITLYHKVNDMMGQLGAIGEINTRAPEVDAVMDALYDIDGGVYNEEFGKELTGRGG